MSLKPNLKGGRIVIKKGQYTEVAARLSEAMGLTCSTLTPRPDLTQSPKVAPLCRNLTHTLASTSGSDGRGVVTDGIPGGKRNVAESRPTSDAVAENPQKGVCIWVKRTRPWGRVLCSYTHAFHDKALALRSLRKSCFQSTYICRRRTIVSSMVQNMCVCVCVRKAQQLGSNAQALEHAGTFVNHISYPMPQL
jgi:hypothetical protein